MENVLSLVNEYVGVEYHIREKTKWCKSVPDGSPCPFTSVSDMESFIKKRVVNQYIESLFFIFKTPQQVLLAKRMIRKVRAISLVVCDVF